MFRKIIEIMQKNFVKNVNHGVSHVSFTEEDLFLEKAILEDLLYPYNNIYVSHKDNVEKIGTTF